MAREIALPDLLVGSPHLRTTRLGSFNACQRNYFAEPAENGGAIDYNGGLEREGGLWGQAVDFADAQLVAALYDAVVEPAGLDAAINAIARRVGCQSASILSFDPTIPPAAVALSVGAFDAKATERYEAEFAAHDPAPAAFMAAPSGTALASNRLFSRDYLRKSPMLHEFLRPLGIEETMGGTVRERDGRFAFFTVHRGRDRADFDDDELALIEFLLPHLNRALQLRRALARMETVAALLGDVIDRLSAGVVILHADGSVAHVNTAARAIATRKDGLWFDRKGMPHALDRAAQQELTRQRLDVLAGGPGGIVRVPRPASPQAYAVLVAPLPRKPGDNESLRGALFLIHDPDAQPASTAESIGRIFSLPAGAAHLIAALVQGEDARDYAERNGISYETVRYHLKTAFARTGVRSQARLMQRATRAIIELSERR